VWLSRAELEALIAEMRTAIVPVLGNEAGPGRAPFMLSPVLFPLDDGDEV
jgi:hypothetical protein